MTSAAGNDASALRDAFVDATLSELECAVAKIDHCASQLNDQQIWWRPEESMNSIANLILHLCGNVRQWMIAGVGGQADERNRPREFSQRDGAAVAELMGMLSQLLEETHGCLGHVSESDLLSRRTIQGYDVTGMQAIIESIAHFRGHTQEITHLTRIQLGAAYRFDFVPGPGQNFGA